MLYEVITVGGHDDSTGEGRELFLLVLPGGAIVADQVRILVQLRVAVSRQHLAVGVDVDAGALGLLQDLLQIIGITSYSIQYTKLYDMVWPV